MYYASRQMLKKGTSEESTETTQQYCHDGTATKITESHRQPSRGKNPTKYCTTGSPWRSTSTPLQELKEFKIRNIGFLQQVQKEEGQQIEGNEEYDFAVDLETGCRFYRQSRANLQTASSSSSTCDQTQWKTRIWNSQHSLTTGEFFLCVRTGFGCLEKNLAANRRRCEQCTHTCSTYRVAQHITFQHAAWLKIKDCTSLFLSNTCHPRVMSHSLPHLTLTTSTSSLSPNFIHFSLLFHFSYHSTSPTFPTVATAPKECLSVTLPACNTAEKSLNVVFVLLRCCRGNADVLSSSLHSVRAGPGSVGRWRASPLLSHFCLISRKMDRLELVIQIWPCALDVRQLVVCKVLGTPF